MDDVDPGPFSTKASRANERRVGSRSPVARCASVRGRSFAPWRTEPAILGDAPNNNQAFFCPPGPERPTRNVRRATKNMEKCARFGGKCPRGIHRVVLIGRPKIQTTVARGSGLSGGGSGLFPPLFPTCVVFNTVPGTPYCTRYSYDRPSPGATFLRCVLVLSVHLLRWPASLVNKGSSTHQHQSNAPHFFVA